MTQLAPTMVETLCGGEGKRDGAPPNSISFRRPEFAVAGGGALPPAVLPGLRRVPAARGRRHGDPFPLPHIMLGDELQLDAHIARRVVQRTQQRAALNRRTNSCIDILNKMNAATLHDKNSNFSERCMGRMTDTRADILCDLRRRVAAYGDRPTDIDPKGALVALQKTKDQ